MDPNALYVALTALIVAVTTILQTWWQQRQQERVAARLATKTDEANDGIAKMVKAVNGGDGGLHSQMEAIKQWQTDHELTDAQRHAQILERLDKLRTCT